MTTGKVTSITTDWRGDTVRTGYAGIDVFVPVYSTVDFDEAGGWLVIGDSEPLRYVGINEDEPWVVLEALTAVTYEEGTPVIVWDPTVGRSGAQVVEYVATVETDTGPVDAVVPHGLIPVSSVENLIGASVRVAEDSDGDWHLDEVFGRDASLSAEVENLRILGKGGSIQQFSESGALMYQLGDLVPFMGGATEEDGSYLFLSSDGDPNHTAFYVSVILPSATYPDGLSVMKFGSGGPDDQAVFFAPIVGYSSISGQNLFATDAPTTGGAANCNLGPGGQVRYSTSSLRYKQDVEAVEVDPAAVLRMEPKTWRDRNAVVADPDTTERHVGFIAEDLHELGLTEFITYNDDGEPDAIQYDRLSVALLAVVQDQERRLTRLENGA